MNFVRLRDIRLIQENFGVAIMPQGTAEQIATVDCVVRPFGHQELQITAKLIARADAQFAITEKMSLRLATHAFGVNKGEDDRNP